jgi:hypothetical protein
MKRKNVLTVGGTLMFALAIAFGSLSISASANSIKQLSAKAGDYCANCNCNSDCHSTATGNNYPGQEAANY